MNTPTAVGPSWQVVIEYRHSVKQVTVLRRPLANNYLFDINNKA